MREIEKGDVNDKCGNQKFEMVFQDQNKKLNFWKKYLKVNV